jgi:hypothetical protein
MFNLLRNFWRKGACLRFLTSARPPFYLIKSSYKERWKVSEGDLRQRSKILALSWLT